MHIQKTQKNSQVKQLFALSGSARVKALRKHVLKIVQVVGLDGGDNEDDSSNGEFSFVDFQHDLLVRGHQ